MIRLLTILAGTVAAGIGAYGWYVTHHYLGVLVLATVWLAVMRLAFLA